MLNGGAANGGFLCISKQTILLHVSPLAFKSKVLGALALLDFVSLPNVVVNILMSENI